MARTDFIRPINPRAGYDRAFFERLFQELTLASFTDVRVHLPGNSDSVVKDLAPDEFLRVTERLDGVCVLAKNTGPPADVLEFLVARRPPQGMFPTLNWTDSDDLRGYVSVKSYDAARPFALTGHFQGFAERHAKQPVGPTFLLVLSIAFLTAQVVSLLVTRRFLNHAVSGWPPAVDVIGIVFNLLTPYWFLSSPSGVVMHETHPPLALLGKLHQEPYKSNPWIKLIYTIVGGTIAAVIAGLILNRINARP